jgi:hypothetical protein
MVDLSFISLLAARFLGTDDADEVFALPGEHNSIHLCIDPYRAQSSLAVVFPVVDPSHDFVGKDFGSGQKRDALFGKVGSGFFFRSPRNPDRCITRPLTSIIHKRAHDHQFSSRAEFSSGAEGPGAILRRSSAPDPKGCPPRPFERWTDAPRPYRSRLGFEIFPYTRIICMLFISRTASILYGWLVGLLRREAEGEFPVAGKKL